MQNDHSVPQARLEDLYEKEVIDFVIAHLDAGVSEAETINALKAHDFGYEEAKRVVRTIAKDRPRTVRISDEQLAAKFMTKLMKRFPDMRPMEGNPPGLVTINGIGTSIYGARDHDPETGTYVKTLVFTVFFLPVFSLGAYRVADAANGGWHFLGRQPLSPLAKKWNIILPVCLLFGLFLLLMASGRR